MTETTHQDTRKVCHRECLEIHAMPSAVENWQDWARDNGMDVDPYSLAWDYADDGATPRWDEVTGATSWQAFDRMIQGVATDYLLDGTVECHRQDW